MAEHRFERPRPVVGALQQGLVRSYVEMLGRLNTAVAQVFKRSRGLVKGTPLLYVIDGGQSDLFKAKGAPSDPAHHHKRYEYWRDGKHVIVEAKGTPTPEDPKKPRTKKKEEAKEHKWYRDDEGHKQFRRGSDERYKTQLSDEEVGNLHKDFATALSGLSEDEVAALDAKLDVDGVVTTLRSAVDDAAAQGVTVEYAFIDAYLRATSENTQKVVNPETGQEEEQPVYTEEDIKDAHEMYGALMEDFTELVDSGEWKKIVTSALKRREKESRRLIQNAEAQKKLVKGTFETFRSGDLMEASFKLAGVIHGLDLLVRPKDEKEVAKHLGVEAEDEAWKYKGNIVVSEDRLATLMGGVDAMSPEQHVALGVAMLLSVAHRTYAEGPTRNDKTGDIEQTVDQKLDELFKDTDFQAHKHTLKWVTDAGINMSGTAVAKNFRERISELAREVFRQQTEYNNHTGGQIFKSLYQGELTTKDILKKDKVVDDLNESVEKARERIKNALEAMGKTDHKIHDEVIRGCQSAAYARAIKNGKSEKEAKADAKEAGLFPYQKAMVAWMEAVESGILAADVGMGKTLMVIACVANLLASKKAKRGIVVVPNALIAQWPKEVASFWPEAKVQIVAASTKTHVGELKFSAEDRVMKLKAINDGDLEADFVIIGQSVFSGAEGFTALKERLVAEEEKRTDSKMSAEEATAFFEGHEEFQNHPTVRELARLEGAMFFDECHQAGLRSPHTITSSVARHVLKGRRYKFGMSATPMANDPADLYHTLQIFSPGVAGDDLQVFNQQMLHRSIDESTGKKTMEVNLDPQALSMAAERLRHAVFFADRSDPKIKKMMEDAHKGLPPLVATGHTLACPPETQEFYDACGSVGWDTGQEGFEFEEESAKPEEGEEPVEGEAPKKRKGKKAKKEHKTDEEMELHLRALAQAQGLESAEGLVNLILKGRAKHRQQLAAISPRLLDKNYRGPEPKLDWAAEVIKRHFSDEKNANHPVAIFCTSVSALELMRQKLAKEHNIPESRIGMITGNESISDRNVTQAAVNAGEIKIVLIGAQAGGAGLNLQNKTFRSILLDRPWTPATISQIIGRTHRTGQTAEKVFIHSAEVEGTRDQDIKEMLRGKISLIDALKFVSQAGGGDIDAQYLEEAILASITKQLGNIDPNAKWSPEEEQQLYDMTGLGDAGRPLPTIKALKTEFKREAFGSDIMKEDWKKNGEQWIDELSLMNNLALKTHRRTPGEHAKESKRIAKFAKEWLEVTEKGMNHPVAKHLGDHYHFVSETEMSAGMAPKKNPAPKAKLPAKHASDNRRAGLAEPVVTLPMPMKLHAKSEITVKSKLRTNPYNINSKSDVVAAASVIVEAIKYADAPPASVKALEEAVAGYFKAAFTGEDKMSAASIKVAVRQVVHDNGMAALSKVVKDGHVEVTG